MTYDILKLFSTYSINSKIAYKNIIFEDYLVYSSKLLIWKKNPHIGTYIENFYCLFFFKSLVDIFLFDQVLKENAPANLVLTY